MAVELSQTSCLDLKGDFQNSSQGQEQKHNIPGDQSRKTREDDSSEKHIINGSLRSPHRVDKPTMPDCCTKSQDFHQSTKEDRITNSTPSTDALCEHTSISSSTMSNSSSITSSPTSKVTSQSAEENTSASFVPASSIETEVNMNRSNTQDSGRPITNNNRENIDSRSPDKMEDSEEDGLTEEELAEKEDELHDIVIPVPVIPKTHSPASTSNTKSSNGQKAGPRSNNQEPKRRHLVRRPTPVKIETPTKLLNKLKMTSPRLVEEEEEPEEASNE